MLKKTKAVLGVAIMVGAAFIALGLRTTAVHAGEPDGCNNPVPDTEEGCLHQADNTPDEPDEAGPTENE